MNRRQLLQNMATVSGGALMLSFLGGSKSHAATENLGQGDLSDGMPAFCADGSEGNYTNPGHPHTVIALTADELAAATPGVYTLMGGRHSHTFEITAEAFEALHKGEEILLEDLEGHGHELALACL